ncbi:ribosomal protein S18 acetylase RimI-like enzyme [Acetoanaerobium pronyense]|uniref:Ribosomal protein S18 acetylase RimI-like enzyme n=1 Tax=Acetoanaerobium pronyense TaxID=1482736 RepID=A0ABS4KLD5_9FIRM|nr:ribosomal protein S18 acetylase RimI-like enzyme [Acetoanaerobium pronyense]
MDNLKYIYGGRELLEFVKPMWNKLNNYHKDNSINFKSHFESLSFEIKLKKFEAYSNLEIMVILVKNLSKDTYLGYSISTVTKDKVGEIDSIYVDQDYRKYGIGKRLMNESIAWLNLKNVNKKILYVAKGNENVFDFYGKCGFYPKMILLEEI